MKTSLFRLMPLLVIIGLMAAAPEAKADIDVVKYTLVSKTKVSKKVFNYTFRITFRNDGLPAFGIHATVSSRAAAISIISGTIDVGDLGANQSRTPNATITVQKDGTKPPCYPEDQNDCAQVSADRKLIWTIVPTRSVVGINQYTNPQDSRLFTANFNNGDSLTLFGNKSTIGTPQTLRSVTAVQSGVTTQLSYQPTGELSSAGTAGGYSFQFAWNSGSVSSVVLTTPEGKRVSAPLALPAATAAAHGPTISVSGTQSGQPVGPLPQLSAPLSISAAASIGSTCDIVLQILTVACTVSDPLLSAPQTSCSLIVAAIVAFDPLLAPAGPAIYDACLSGLTTAKVVCKLGTAGAFAAAGAICHAIDSIIDQVTTPTATLTANPTNVAVGEATLLSWSSTWATDCVASGGASGDGWAGSVFLNGQLLVSENVDNNYTYIITCTEDTRTKSSSVTVRVGSPPKVTLSVDSAQTTTAQPITLTWTSTDATSCLRSGGGPGDGWGGKTILNGAALLTESIPGTYTYTLTCTDALGDGTAEVTVVVSDSGPPTVTLTASQPSIQIAGQVTLSWTTTNAQSCNASGGAAGDGWGGATVINGAALLTESVAGNYTFTLSCTGTQGTSSAQVGLIVSSSGQITPGTYVSSFPLVVSATTGCGIINITETITLSITVPVNGSPSASIVDYYPAGNYGSGSCISPQGTHNYSGSNTLNLTGNSLSGLVVVWSPGGPFLLTYGFQITAVGSGQQITGTATVQTNPPNDGYSGGASFTAILQ